MRYILDLQEADTSPEERRGLSNTSDWLCYSTTSWSFC